MSDSSPAQDIAIDPPRPWRLASAKSDERSLLRAAQRGSAEAIEGLVRSNWDIAHQAAYLIVHDASAAEDIAQEAMLAALKALDRFDRRRPFRPWLHRIVVNRSLDWLRADNRRPTVSIDDLSLDRLPKVEPDQSNQLSEDVLRAMASLDPGQRAVVVLRHVLDYRPSEIARLLDEPGGTVRSRLHRALSLLRAQLDPAGGESHE